jgi:hypothetical protein
MSAVVECLEKDDAKGVDGISTAPWTSILLLPDKLLLQLPSIM